MGCPWIILLFGSWHMCYRLDASKFGLGGISILAVSGIMKFQFIVIWGLHWTLLSSLHAWLLFGWMPRIPTLLLNPAYCQTDSSTATGWLKKSNSTDKPDKAVQLKTTSDALSRDFHLPPETLSNLLCMFQSRHLLVCQYINCQHI
jgi:hypothetical protein